MRRAIRLIVLCLSLLGASSAWAQWTGQQEGVYASSGQAHDACNVVSNYSYSCWHGYGGYPGGLDYWQWDDSAAQISHQFGIAAGGVCPAGTTANATTGKCEASAPPPSCGENQHVDTATNQCTGDTPQPTPGAKAPAGMWAVGTSTATGVDYNSVGQTLVGGGNVLANCGGWSCSFGGAAQVGSQCYDNGVGTTVYCEFEPTYSSVPASLAQAGDVSSSVPPTGSAAITPTTGCPSGFASDGAGGCISTGTGTPATATAASGAAPTATSCPVGYAKRADGACVSSGPTLVGCPAGYSAQPDGSCVGTASGSGSGSGVGSGCGGAGQPACSIAGNGTVSGTFPTRGAMQQLIRTPGSRTFSGVLGAFKDRVQLTPVYAGIVGFFNVTVPGGACSGLDTVVSFSVGDVSGSWPLDLTSTFCGVGAEAVYALMSIALMLGAAWAAFRIAIL